MCEAPLRDRSGMYRIFNTVFFALSVIAILGRFSSHIAFGRLQPLDDGNMALILVSFLAQHLTLLTLLTLHRF